MDESIINHKLNFDILVGKVKFFPYDWLDDFVNILILFP
jgi:hypothetical protein